MLSIECVHSNCFIQGVLAKCQPLASSCAGNVHTKKIPPHCEGADPVWGWGGGGEKRGEQTLTLMCCGKYSNRWVYRCLGYPGRDGLALPREIEESFIIHTPPEERGRRRRVLNDAPWSDGHLRANTWTPSSLWEVWEEVLCAWALSHTGD